MYLPIKHSVSTSTLALALLCAAGCFPNPNFENSTTADVDSGTTTSGMASSEASGTITSDVSSDVSSYTTSDDTTEGTQGFDLPLDSEGTVDPGTTTEGTTTSGETTDPSDSENDSDSEGETMAMDFCPPYDPPQKFEIQVFQEGNPVVQDCGTQEFHPNSKVEWIGESQIKISSCTPDCAFCEPVGKSYAVDYPGGDEDLKLTPETLEEGTCTELYFWYDQPEGEEDCAPSAIAIKDVKSEPYRQFLAASGINFIPSLDLGITIQKANPDCGICDAECCFLPSLGPHTLSFEDLGTPNSTDDLPEGADDEFEFVGRTATAKNILATGHEICDIPQQFAWVVTSLPDY